MNPLDILSVIWKIVGMFIKKAAWDGYFLYACEKIPLVNEKTMKEVANYTYHKSSLKVLPTIREWLSNNDYSEEVIEAYILAFVDNCKDSFPIIYLLYNQEKLGKTLIDIVNNDRDLREKIECLNHNCSLNYQTIDEVEEYLKQCAKEPQKRPVNLSLFDFKDPDFTNDLSNALSNDTNPVVVSGEYQKETFFAFLFEMKKMFPDDYSEKVFIFSSREDYLKALAIQLPEESILINCFFNDESIPFVRKYKNIHIVSKWKSKNSTVRLKPRIKDSLRKALEDNDYSTEDISNIMRLRKNVFHHLLRNLIEETDSFEAKVSSNIELRVISASIMINRFSLENKNDIVFIEKLSGYDIDTFIEKLLTPMLAETPFAKEISSFSQREIAVLDFEGAFNAFSDEIKGSLLNRFFAMAKEALCDLPYKYTVDNYIKKNDEEMYSDSILTSILETLLFFVVEGKYKRQCEDVVNSFISWIDEHNDEVPYIEYFSDYLDLLVEINPRLINNMISRDIHNNNGIYLLFNKQKKNDYFNSINKYTNVLWGLEKLLFINSEREQSVTNLFNLFKIEQKYCLTNSPGRSLKTFFAAWINVTPAKNNERKEICERLFSVDCKAAWDIFVDLLYSGGGESVTPFSGPRYIKYDPINSQTTIADAKEMYVFYSDIVTKNTNTIEQLVRLIEKHSFVYFEEEVTKIIKRIITICKDSNDDEKVVVVNKIKDFIYSNRRFASSNWSAPEKIIKRFEKLLNRIVFVNPEITFVCLFVDYEVKEPHPIEYSSESHDYNLEEEHKNKYIEECYHNFIQQNLNINFLYSYFEKRPSISVLPRFYNFIKKYETEHLGKSFDVFIDTIVEKAPHVCGLYVFLGRELYQKKKDNYYLIAYKLIKKSVPIRSIIDYLYVVEINVDDEKYVDLYNALPNNIRDNYWKSIKGFVQVKLDNPKNVEFVVENVCLSPEDESVKSALDIMYHFSRYYHCPDKADWIFKFLDNIPLEYLSKCDEYVLEELLKVLHDKFAFTTDLDIEMKIAGWEMIIISNNNFDIAICLKNLLGREPQFYFYFIKILYIEKNGDTKVHQNVFSLLYFTIKFCPGYHHGAFDEEVFHYWIENFKKLIYDTEFDEKEWLFYSYIGKLFRYAKSENDLPMPITIINYIENVNEEKAYEYIKDYYCIEVNNSMGVRTITDGSDLLRLAKQNKTIAKKLKDRGFTKTSEIYESIAKDFNRQAEIERKRAEDEW